MSRIVERSFLRISVGRNYRFIISGLSTKRSLCIPYFWMQDSRRLSKSSACCYGRSF